MRSRIKSPRFRCAATVASGGQATATPSNRTFSYGGENKVTRVHSAAELSQRLRANAQLLLGDCHWPSWSRFPASDVGDAASSAPLRTLLVRWQSGVQSCLARDIACRRRAWWPATLSAPLFAKSTFALTRPRRRIATVTDARIPT